MEGNKVAPVPDWPEPWSVKDLQRFLGFAFYRRFIRGFSALAVLLMDLLKSKKGSKSTALNANTQHAFQQLKD